MSKEGDQTCWLCGRVFDGSPDWHHPVPKAKKGRVKVAIHAICHEAIHANYTNSQLARIGDDRAALLENPALVNFIGWVKDKPPGFHAPTRNRR